MDPKKIKKPATKRTSETELKAAKKKIAELEEKIKALSASELNSHLLRSLVDYSPSVITILNVRTGVFEEINSTAEKLFGYTRKELLSMGPSDISPESQPNGRDSKSFAMEKVGLALKGEIPIFKWNHSHKNGTIIPCEIHLVLIPGTTHLVRGNIIDLRSEIAAEALLKSKEERLDLVIKSADLGFWDWNITEGSILPNEKWASLLGYTLQELDPNYKFWESSVHPEDYEKTVNQLNLHLKGELELFDADFRMKCKDGSWKWIRSRGKVWERDKKGNPIRALGIHLDISESKETERILEEKERTLDLAVQGANLGIWDFNVKTNEHHVDENWQRMIGYVPGEINPTFQFWNDNLYPEDRERTHEAWQAYIRGEVEAYSTAFRLKCKDGSYKWILTRGKIAERDPLGNPLRMIGIHIDISEQKQTEDELLETKLFLDRAQKTAKVGSWEYDISTGKITASDELYQILETKDLGEPDTFKGAHPEDRDKIAEHFRRSVEEGIAEELEYRSITPSGVEKILLNRTDFIRDAEGRVQKLLGTVQDITLQRKKEKEEERKRDLERLTSSISTELINQPILEIENAIYNTIRKVTHFFNMERGNLVTYDLNTMTRTHVCEYIHPNAKNQAQTMPKETTINPDHPLSRALLAGSIVVTDVEDFVSFDKEIKMPVHAMNIKSIVAIPLTFEGKIVGGMGINSEKTLKEREHPITDFELSGLKAIGELLTNALERKRKHSELVAERDLLSEIMRTSVAAITVLGPDGSILYANPSAEKVLGLTLDEIQNRKYNAPEWKATSIDGGEWTVDDQPFVRVKRSGQPVYDVRHAIEDDRGNKKYLSINGAPIKDSDGNITNLVFLIIDITESLLAEKALKQNEDRYRRVAEQTGQLVYDQDLPSGKITWAGAVEKITGYNFQEFQHVDETLRIEFIHPEDRSTVVDSVNYAKMNGGYFTAEYRFLRKDGQYIIVEDKGVFVKNSNLETNRLLGAMADITERRKAQNDLIESEERLRLALNASKMGTWSWNLIDGSVYWSSDTVAIFGIKNVDKHEWSSEQFMSLAHPDDKDRIEKSVRESIRGGSSDIHLEFRMFHPDGTIRWLEVRGQVYRKSGKMPSRMAGIVMDITDRKKSEEKLKASEARFQTFYRFANEAIIFLHPRTEKILDINPAFLRIFGFAQKDVQSISPVSLFTPNSWATLHARIRSFESSENLELEAVRWNGQVFSAIGSVHFYTEKDSFVAAISLSDTSALQEVQELKVINDEISVRNRLIEMQKNELLETLDNLKKAQAQLIQSEKMAALGQLIAGVAHEINNPIGAVQASNQNLQECLIRFQTILPDVQTVLAAMNSDQVEAFRSFLGLVRQSKEQLAGLEERNAKKGIVSQLQELNIPNHYAIAEALVDMGFRELPKVAIPFLVCERANILLEYSTLEAFFFLNTNTIQMAVDRVSKILYALKNFSHFDTTSEKILTSIPENIETVLTIYQNQLKKGIQVTKEYENIPKILCFPDDLMHVWTNLIYNSLQAMDFRGEIKIRAYQKSDCIAVEIRDNGPGIPDAILDKIFQPFFTTKLPGEGSGLGLDIVKKIVEKHEGKIEVETAPGATTFRILLPILKGEE
ncbi:PAS domain S-box protein [Leptospira langatensis]|uniref:histidine kinase n=1 Tax=Leptospira langatensis TaxID=2484983 RepID=A0A5F1ZW53_9LEPT|nr:PAS domain-containing protein [Leptospira langatensis]TGK00006.1 PAS domain S-box protein [Leptospira langatensis]TGL42641.1 PAS domain S-box protein [Leptospira langatensis]